MGEMIIFNAGDGINVNSLNTNFDNCKNDANTNEIALNQIAATALKIDGSNLTQNIINAFNQSSPNIITTGGNIPLTDNSVNFLTLTANGTIQLPAVPSDSFSHTIILMVKGGTYSLNLGTTKYILNYLNINIANMYSVMFIYNKLDNSWYYSLTQ